MTVSATLAIWTLRLFPGRGAQGFTAALIVVGAGSALGPALAGPVIDSLGARAAFLGFAGPAGAVSAGFAAGASGRARRGPAIPGVGNRRGD
jgi:hypothetical protein